MSIYQMLGIRQMLHVSSLIKLCLLSFLFIVSSCAKHDDSVRIAISPWPGYSYFYIADKLGCFDEYGVNVELIHFLSLSDSTRAFELGQVDAWLGTPVELLMTQYHSNKKPKAVWVTNVSTGGDVILTKKSIASINDLKGKRIGIEPATVNVLLLHSALEKASIALSEITLVQLPYNKMKYAITSDQVDAVVIYSPESIAIENLSTVHRIYDSSNAPNLIVDLFAVSEVSLEKKKNQYEKIWQAYKKAVLYVNENRDIAKEMISEFTGIPISNVDESLAGITFVSPDQQIEFFKMEGHMSVAIDKVGNVLRASNIPIAYTQPDKLFTDILVAE